MPEEVRGKNVVIEMNFDVEILVSRTLGKSCFLQEFKTFYSSMLKVKINEKLGELKVYSMGKTLAKAYVKVFCKENNGAEVFFKDGYTDIRGKFEYASASGTDLGGIQKFAILVSDKNNGQIIKEAKNPNDV